MAPQKFRKIIHQLTTCYLTCCASRASVRLTLPTHYVDSMFPFPLVDIANQKYSRFIVVTCSLVRFITK
ncbi:hypothetical protein EG68_01669 [Paragonimus skrjabini miyazakii]|uniref:Uncharacterized protein n=1 Tax=Paragonimus skrjabini miyazakii TaxID=59628 RepID=A0A8S9Z603_9TREM|nr:hypothetical protein EG68_01669 [Paragonimus skrjabini miyazakii]